MEAPVREGDVLAGKYRVERVLGAGGMGVVVAALHMQLEQRVAIKFLLPEAMGNAEVVARFSREARAAVKIQSEHVARVIDVGELPGGLPYMVMEYLDGDDLGAVLRARSTLPTELAVDYLLQACEAISEAHAAGIVHRDLKPANLFLAQRTDGTQKIKVLDFGISKTTALSGSQPDLSLTKTSALMGSPLYMSPEQLRSSRQVDMRSDIWSLGMVLYELIAGRTAFIADALPELCARILTEAAPPLRTFRPDASPALEALVARCLEKDPALRFSSVAELTRALVPFGPRGAHLSAERASRFVRTGAPFADGSEAMVASDGVPRPPYGMAETAASWGAAETKGARSRAGGSKTGVAALVVGGFVVLGVAGFFVVQRRAPPSGDVAPSTAAAAATAAPPLTPAAAPPAIIVSPTDSAAPAPAVAPVPTASAAATAQVRALGPRLPASVLHPRTTAAPVAAPPPPSPVAAPPPTSTPAPPPAAPRRNPLNIEIK